MTERDLKELGQYRWTCRSYFNIDMKTIIKKQELKAICAAKRKTFEETYKESTEGSNRYIDMKNFDITCNTNKELILRFQSKDNFHELVGIEEHPKKISTKKVVNVVQEPTESSREKSQKRKSVPSVDVEPRKKPKEISKTKQVDQVKKFLVELDDIGPVGLPGRLDSFESIPNGYGLTTNKGLRNPFVVRSENGAFGKFPKWTFDDMKPLSDYTGVGLDDDVLYHTNGEELEDLYGDQNCTFRQMFSYLKHPLPGEFRKFLHIEFLTVGRAHEVNSIFRPPRILEEFNIQRSRLGEDKTYKHYDLSRYLQIVEAGGYTLPHSDYSGPVSFLFVRKGEKVVFMLLDTTEADWEIFQENEDIFYKKWVKEKRVVKIVLKEGMTLVFPGTNIHSVFTPVNTLVYSGSVFTAAQIERSIWCHKVHYNLWEGNRRFCLEQFPGIALSNFAIVMQDLFLHYKFSTSEEEREMFARIRSVFRKFAKDNLKLMTSVELEKSGYKECANLQWPSLDIESEEYAYHAGGFYYKANDSDLMKKLNHFFGLPHCLIETAVQLNTFHRFESEGMRGRLNKVSQAQRVAIQKKFSDVIMDERIDCYHHVELKLNTEYSLYSMNNIVRDTYIGEYSGEVMTDEQLATRYSPFADVPPQVKKMDVELTKRQLYIDPSYRSNFSFLLNESPEGNLEIVTRVIGGLFRLMVKTMRDVKVGEALMIKGHQVTPSSFQNKVNVEAEHLPTSSLAMPLISLTPNIELPKKSQVMHPSSPSPSTSYKTSSQTPIPTLNSSSTSNTVKRRKSKKKPSVSKRPVKNFPPDVPGFQPLKRRTSEEMPYNSLLSINDYLKDNVDELDELDEGDGSLSEGEMKMARRTRKELSLNMEMIPWKFPTRQDLEEFNEKLAKYLEVSSLTCVLCGLNRNTSWAPTSQELYAEVTYKTKLQGLTRHFDRIHVDKVIKCGVHSCPYNSLDEEKVVHHRLTHRRQKGKKQKKSLK